MQLVLSRVLAFPAGIALHGVIVMRPTSSTGNVMMQKNVLFLIIRYLKIFIVALLLFLYLFMLLQGQYLSVPRAFQLQYLLRLLLRSRPRRSSKFPSYHPSSLQSKHQKKRQLKSRLLHLNLRLAVQVLCLL